MSRAENNVNKDLPVVWVGKRRIEKFADKREKRERDRSTKKRKAIERERED
jgi:hypothetical protein